LKRSSPAPRHAGRGARDPRLRETPRSTQTAFVACARFADVTRLLKHMDGALGGSLSAFEVMWNEFYRLVTTPPAKGAPPISQDHPYYVLIESSGGDAARDQAQFEEALGAAIESGIVADVVIATSEAQRESLWALRDDIEQFFRLGMPVGFDISLPVPEMEAYVGRWLDSKASGPTTAASFSGTWATATCISSCAGLRARKPATASSAACTSRWRAGAARSPPNTGSAWTSSRGCPCRAARWSWA
jgi:FAD/FMN-containing dehydrogenase